MTEQIDSHNESAEIRAIVKDVLLNTQAQEQWIDEASDQLLIAVDVFSRHIMDQDKKDIFRHGIIVGATYERWRQARKGPES